MPIYKTKSGYKIANTRGVSKTRAIKNNKEKRMTKKAKANVGRPTIMTDLTLQKLKEAFAFGCTDEEACYYAEIGKSTLYNYQNDNPEFLEQKEALLRR